MRVVKCLGFFSILCTSRERVSLSSMFWSKFGLKVEPRIGFLDLV